jgi:hypothetical protein
MKNRKIKLIVGHINASSNRLSTYKYSSDRIVLMAIQILYLMRDVVRDGPTGRSPPNKVRSKILRMQGAQL